MSYYCKTIPCAFLSSHIHTHLIPKIPNTLINKTKVISFSPGGILGFYLLGISTFIKDNYDVSDYHFSGASAGAWNAFFMCYKKDAKKLALDLIHEMEENSHNKNLNQLEHLLKKKILTDYQEDDFDLSKLKIGITKVGIVSKMKIISDFANLEDAIHCCMSSSHIPFVTGNLINRYKEDIVLDGGLTYGSLVKTVQPVIDITPSIWNSNHDYTICDTIRESRNINKQRFKMRDLFLEGYEDAKKNKSFLDSIFDIDKYNI